MNRKRCQRAWEVEAARNGQLSAGGLRAYREHLASECRDCNEQLHFLDRLAGQLYAAGAREDEVARRRLRQAVLERARAVAAPRFRGVARRALLTTAWLACAAAPLSLLRWHGSPHAELAAPASLVDVIPLDKRSVFHRVHEHSLERVDLIDGVFTLVVRRGPTDPRVLVRIPEGEIEDVGTTFSVTVLGGHTLRIVVNQGAVLLHRPGMSPVRLEAGSVWEPAPPSPPPSAAGESVQRAPETPQPATPAAPKPVRPQVRRAAVAPMNARVTAPAAAETLQDEDGMYLELLRLVRRHDLPAAQLMAADYLTRHPDGFRRADVERVLRGLGAYD